MSNAVESFTSERHGRRIREPGLAQSEYCDVFETWMGEALPRPVKHQRRDVGAGRISAEGLTFRVCSAANLSMNTRGCISTVGEHARSCKLSA